MGLSGSRDTEKSMRNHRNHSLRTYSKAGTILSILYLIAFSTQPYEVCAIIFILQMRKLGLRKIICPKSYSPEEVELKLEHECVNAANSPLKLIK